MGAKVLRKRLAYAARFSLPICVGLLGADLSAQSVYDETLQGDLPHYTDFGGLLAPSFSLGVGRSEIRGFNSFTAPVPSYDSFRFTVAEGTYLDSISASYSFATTPPNGYVQVLYDIYTGNGYFTGGQRLAIGGYFSDRPSPQEPMFYGSQLDVFPLGPGSYAFQQGIGYSEPLTHADWSYTISLNVIGQPPPLPPPASLSPPPSPLELAQFNSGAAVAGYRPIEIASQTPGFSARAFVSPSGDRVVLAIAGSNEWRDWTGPNPTFITPSGAPTAAMTDYVEEAADMVALLRRDYPGAEVMLTGHSLGGAIAQIVAHVGGLDATTFNAPGVGGTVDAFTGQLSQLGAPRAGPHETVNYRIYGDLVSTAGSELGSVRTVTLEAPADIALIVDLLPETTAKAVHELTTMIERLVSNAPVAAATGPTLLDVTAGLLTNSPGRSFEGSVRWGVFGVVAAHEVFWVDPAGMDLYEFDLNAGSPSVASVLFPFILNRDATFRLEEWTNEGWLARGMFGELGEYEFGGEGARRFRFFVLGDGLGDWPAFDFGLTFAASGYVDAQLTASSTAAIPEPDTLVLMLASLLCTILVIRRRMSEALGASWEARVTDAG
jgi:hypothetical protein